MMNIKTYQIPLKNPAAASLSFLMGLTVIAAIALSLRVTELGQPSQEVETTSETIPVDPSVADTQRRILDDREQKLGSRTASEQKQISTTITTPVAAPAPTAASSSKPASATKQSNRTTKTS